jgi:predicted nucleic acid-binding Zn ribbon protein
MFFLNSKKRQKWVNTAWTVIGVLVIVSMVMLYIPAFMDL